MNPLDFYKVLLRTKQVQKGFLAKKMIPPALRTFLEHGAREHLRFFVK